MVKRSGKGVLQYMYQMEDSGELPSRVIKKTIYFVDIKY